ncbi:MAG: hypothetical protein ACREKE_04350 [bacterium]
MTSIIVDNHFSGTCAAVQARPVTITAALDQDPIVTLPDRAKFQFANLAPGRHCLTFYSVGAPMEGGHGTEVLRFNASAGGTEFVELGCAADGSVSLSGPSAR